MPWYNDLRPETDEHKERYALLFPEMDNEEKKRTITSLLNLRYILDVQIAKKISNKNLLICTWNIKEFGHLDERMPESYFYIAEILNRFDLIAIQEVKSKLDDLKIIMRLLGSHWKYMIADITEGRDGNSERFAYLYDQRRVSFSGLAGEIVLWDDLTKDSGIKQLKRTPYITGFKAGWKSFAIINVHLHPGNKKKDQDRRREEVRLLMKAIKKKIMGSRFWTDNLMLMGDFNLYKNNGDIVQIIRDSGFTELDDLKGKLTNASQTEIYDRIFIHKTKYFNPGELTSGLGGDVFKVFDYVFMNDKVETYHSIMKAHKNNPNTLTDNKKYREYYKRYWRRNQISDHYPVWIQLNIDSSNAFLKEKLKKFV